MGCLAQARYSMTAEIYDETTIQNASGQILRSWDYVTPTVVSCVAHGIVDGGIRVAGSTERWQGKYADVEWVHLNCQERLSKRQRVGNIKNSDGVLLFPADMVFDILGVTPMTDPFGNITEFDILAAKAEKK